MSEKDITSLIKAIHEQETHKAILAEVNKELEQGIPDELMSEVEALIAKVESSKSNVVAFLKKTISLGETDLMAASSQNIGEWFAQPIVFAASGFIVDIRKILGSEDDVDVYIYPNGADEQLIEKTLLPFKDQSLKVKFSINEKEFLNAEIYVDDTGHAAEGSGHLKSVSPEDVHGTLNFEVIVED